MKPAMDGHYWRLNPRMEKEILLDNADAESRALMTETVQAYIH
jgi:hypothetical protein